MNEREQFALDHDLTYAAEASLSGTTPSDSSDKDVVREIVSGDLPGGIEGLVADRTIQVKPAKEGDPTERVITTAMTRIPESAGFIPALTAHDARQRSFTERLVGAGGLIPLFDHIEFESIKFNATYRVGTIKGQDQNWVRQLFSPSFIDYLAERAPDGCYFDLYGGMLFVASNEAITTAPKLEEFCEFAAQIANRLRSEAEESKGITGPVELPISRMREKAANALNEQVDRVSFSSPPPSVGAAAKKYRGVARRRWLPWVFSFGIAAFVTLVGAGFAGLFVAGFTAQQDSTNDVRNGLIAFLAVGTPLFLWLFISMLRAQLRSSATAWGLEAFLRGYAKDRGLAFGDVDRFQYEHNLQMPLRITRILEGDLPGANMSGRLLVYAPQGGRRGAKGTLAVVSELKEGKVPTVHLAPRGTVDAVTILGGFFLHGAKGVQEPKSVSEARERLRSRVGEEIWKRYSVLVDPDADPQAIGDVLTDEVRTALGPDGERDPLGLIVDGPDVVLYGAEGRVDEWSTESVDAFCARAGRAAAAVAAAAR